MRETQVYEVATGLPVGAVLQVAGATIPDATFSPDGQKVALLAQVNRTVRRGASERPGNRVSLFHWATGETVWESPSLPPEPRSVDYHPFGTQVAVLCARGELAILDAVSGEILDPKCYFGVMKLGEGKVHKSCAIRCISGGIPPVMRVELDSPKYLIVLGPEGQKINREILDYIAEPVTLEGTIDKASGLAIRAKNQSIKAQD